MKKFKLFPAIIAAASLLTVSTAFAEGSRDLVGRDVEQTDGSHKYEKDTSYYRPYLVYGQSENAGQKMLTTIYVYAQEGETVNFGTNVVFDSKYAPYGLKGEKNEYGTSGRNIAWNFACNMMSIVGKLGNGGGAVGWNDNQWRTSTNPDKFATIAVSICGDSYKAYPTATQNGDFKQGSEINNATSTDVGKTVYLFTADSGEATQIKDEYEEIESAYIALSDSDKPSQVKGLTKVVDESRSYTKGKIGYISNTIEEVAGPNGVIPYYGTTETTNGYNPLSFTAPMTGTYAFRFMTNDVAYQKNATESKLSDETDSTDLHSYNNQAPHIAMWDVTVSGTDKKAKSGRVWTDVLNLNMGAQVGTLGSNVYVLTNDGFEYQVNFNGMKPFGFSFFSNSRGFLLKDSGSGKIQSMNHSYFSYDNRPGVVGTEGVGKAPIRKDVDSEGNVKTTEVLLNAIPTEEGKDFNHKIFFNRVDAAAAAEYTDNGIGVRTKEKEPTYTEEYRIEFTGEGSSRYNENDQTTNVGNQQVSYHSGTEGIGGYFTVKVPSNIMTVNASNTFSIKLDFSQYKLENGRPVRTEDGTWQSNVSKTEDESNNVVTLSSNSFILQGQDYECVMRWDGRDAYGNVVPPGIYSQIITSYWQSGTAHFPLLDVEYAPYGIKMKMLNDIDLVDGKSKDTIYYNNAGVSGEGASAWYFNESTDGTNYAPSAWKSITLLGNYDVNPGNDAAYGKSNINAINGVSTHFDSVNPYGALRSQDYNVNNMLFTPGNLQPTFRGMAPGDHTAIDIWMRYATRSKEQVMAIGVNPRTEDRSPVTPYVSFVGETREDKLNVPSNDSETAEVGTHVGYFNGVTYTDDIESKFASGTWNQVEFPNDHGSATGENYFGNTVSTEFVVDIKPDVYTYDKVRWTITIPTDSTYVKTGVGEDTINLAGVTMNLGTAVLTDTDAALSTDTTASTAELDYNNASTAVDMEIGQNDEVTEGIGDEMDGSSQLNDGNADDGIYFEDDKIEDFAADEDIPTFGFFDDEAELNATTERKIGPPKVNKGAIFPVTAFSETGTAEDSFGTLRFRYQLPTQITGSTNVVYGLVIDNLYAPKAVASEIRFEPMKVENDVDYIELNNDNSVSSTNGAKGYYENDANEYWKVDPNNTDRNQDTVNQ